ncbi:MarR family transcriptional regulator [Spongiactinospora rosea]|uniref:MarR family transcriptional regulator n=1 Tax=Spongiactinospora rosea TaxID=2248750 RepID=A0A366LVD1_9ACTN|nr:MarR family transcriptional regulator [Spongiactinospora rosea]RBQ17727.1 MarR family transcriptional regulator [Spongiactinospora rosea]
MPGGRLSQQERRQIGDGLAEGLTYTEIALRLNRPLSTITREVARNGGPTGYQADRAHEATKERAKRSHPAPGDRDPTAVSELEERFTGILAATGLSRMTARVLASLYLTDSGSLTAAELTRRLQVSPASISKAIGELERQEMVRRERDPRRRRDRYVIDADALFRAWVVGARQNTLVADFARHGAQTLGPTSPAGMRLREVGDFFDHLGRAMARAAEEWRRIH